jgi:hypothetical protein
MYPPSSWEKKKNVSQLGVNFEMSFKTYIRTFMTAKIWLRKNGQIFKMKFVTNWTTHMVNLQAET